MRHAPGRLVPGRLAVLAAGLFLPRRLFFAGYCLLPGFGLFDVAARVVFDSAQAPDPADDGAVRTYEVSTQSYALTVQASAQTDEIPYVRFEVLAWDEDVSGINLLMAVWRLLELGDAYGVQHLDWYGFVWGHADDEGTVTGESEEDFGLEGVSFALSASSDGLPVLEVAAR